MDINSCWFETVVLIFSWAYTEHLNCRQVCARIQAFVTIDFKLNCSSSAVVLCIVNSMVTDES